MFEKIAERISNTLEVKKIIKAENRDFYSYGLQLALNKLFFFVIILIISIFTKAFLVSVAFLLMYSIIRQFSGGFHCKSEINCFLVSILIYLIMLLLYRIDRVEGKWVLYIAALVSVLIISIFSPVEHKNKPLSTDERKKYGIIAVIVAIALVIIMCASLLLNTPILFYSSSYSLTADAVLVILALKEVKHNERDLEIDSSDC